MSEVKKPQDHKKKATKAEPETLESMDPFVFEWAGETYEFAAEDVGKHATPGFFRRNRGQSESDMSWTLMELLDRDDILNVLDGSWAAVERFGPEFGAYFKRVLAVVMAAEED